MYGKRLFGKLEGLSPNKPSLLPPTGLKYLKLTQQPLFTFAWDLSKYSTVILVSPYGLDGRNSDSSPIFSPGL
jgi:hypothetical protein